MEEVLVKRLNRLAKIVGISILMLGVIRSIPCVADGHQSASAALTEIQAENRWKNQTPKSIQSFRDESSKPPSSADSPALVAGKTSSVRSLQKTEAIYLAASEFLDTVRNDDMLARFLKKQETHSQSLDFANMHTFMI